MSTQRLVTSNEQFRQQYEHLQAGDVIVGRLRLRKGEEHLLIDLLTRGIHLIPSATAQLCSRSKVAQARLLGTYMVPGTRTIYDRHDLKEMISYCGRQGYGKLVCKLDQGNAGQGILLFHSIEDVLIQTTLGQLAYPFVLQPLLQQVRDVRVVVLAHTVIAYQRHNPWNFRHNLSRGGQCRPWSLSTEQRSLCQNIMQRAHFPYAFIDLLVDRGEQTYLSEINLRGGLRGAPIDQNVYIDAVEQIHATLLQAHLNTPARSSKDTSAEKA